MPRLIRLALLLVLAGCSEDGRPTPVTGPRTPPEPAPQPDVAWLRERVVPLRTVEPGADDADLEPLRAMIGDARVVLLGEATHGTHEFFAMKHRIVDFLVREMGFDAFAIEAAWGEAHGVDRYVRTGEGDPEVLLSWLRFWTWNTGEVLGLIESMRSWNASTPSSGQIGFHGVDIQSPGRPLRIVEEFLDRVAPPDAAWARERYDCVRGHVIFGRTAPPQGDYLNLSPTEQAACRARLQEVHERLRTEEKRFAAASTDAEAARALRAARLVVQWEEMKTSTFDFGVRDRHMAENTAWVLEQAGPNAKVVVWAHNLHTAYRPDAMGHFLRERLGDQVVSLGFAFDQGSFNAVLQQPDGSVIGPRAVSVGPSGPGSYNGIFREVGEPIFLLDLRSAAAEPRGRWLEGPFTFRTVGAVYAPAKPNAFYYLPKLSQEFDLLVYVDRSTPTALRPFRYE